MPRLEDYNKKTKYDQLFMSMDDDQFLAFVKEDDIEANFNNLSEAEKTAFLIRSLMIGENSTEFKNDVIYRRNYFRENGPKEIDEASNAKENIIGKNNVYEWVNDNGVADLVRNGTSIQQKYYQKDLSLNAIAEHLKKYPNFLKEGGKYQIPKDQYEKLQYLRSIPENEANKLATNDGTFSLKQWRKVNDFFKEGSIDINSIEPANLEYSEVQKKVANSTINKEKAKIKETDNEIRNKIINENKPTLSEGIKVTAISSIVEGGTTFVSLIKKKKKEKKFIKNFTLGSSRTGIFI